MTFHEWLAGCSLILDLGIILTLSGYLWHKRSEAFTSHYCVATGLIVYMSGHTLRTWITWYILFTNPQYDTQVALRDHFPLVGNDLWLVGSIVAAVGLIKLLKTFGESYSGPYIWLCISASAVLLPLFSLWF